MRLLRYIKYFILIVIALALVVLAMANRGPVVLTLLPAELALWTRMDYTIELPLFVVILAGVGVGVMIGYILEWLREYRHRAAATTHQREAQRLDREVKAMKDKQNEGKDEILALVEDAGPAR